MEGQKVNRRICNCIRCGSHVYADENGKVVRACKCYSKRSKKERAKDKEKKGREHSA